MPQDLPTIEARIPAVELARAPERALDHVPDEVPVPVVKFDGDFSEERRKKRKEMKEIQYRKLAQAGENRKRIIV